MTNRSEELERLADELDAYAQKYSGDWAKACLTVTWCDMNAIVSALRTAAAASSAGAAYAERLAVALWEKHYKATAPEWKPLTGDLIGLLTQIDNMTSALIPEPAKAGGAVLLREALDKIEAKIDQLKHYRDNDCQLDHARTIADGRIQQAEMDAGWLRAALSMAQPDTAAQGGKQSDGGVESRHADAFAQPRGVEPEVAPGPSDPAPAEPMSGLYLDRFEVRRILIEQPDENLEITEAILADIDALPIHTHPIAPAAPVSVDEVAVAICKAGEGIGFVNHLPIKLVEHIARALLDAFKMENR